jgi:hypothetical protein
MYRWDFQDAYVFRVLQKPHQPTIRIELGLLDETNEQNTGHLQGKS